tara:strand:- start:237 stop:1121 length:885 start_codon:yes stop_codon:yes gene_type:complete
MSDNMEMQPIQPPGQNPLAKHFRQPKIYINLPSAGKYWKAGSIEYPENGQLPIYAMTAKDEITMSTPDALLNGQSTVDIIQSCVPAIKDAWYCPSIDLDTLLIAIRIATYGEKLTMSAKVPNTDIEKSFELDMRTLLDNYTNAKYEDVLKAGDFLVQIKPMPYKTFTSVAMKTFEEQRLLQTVSNEDMKQEEKLVRFQKSFKTMTDINVSMICDSISAIQYQEEDPVKNPQHIREFVENADAKVYNAIKSHVEKIKDEFTTRPMKVEATEEEIKAGAPKTYEVPIVFDQSNFFG